MKGVCKMNPQAKEIRKRLSKMAPMQAAALIQSFGLPEYEEETLIFREIRGKSLQQIADLQNVSIDTVKRRRRAALSKMRNSL